ncbi:MAG: hypothetical protein ACM4D3_07245 [Candidatus Sericytochromatia bacterium]
MLRPLHVITAVTATALASAVITAAPAAATENEYLRQLEPKYPFLTRQQLLDAASRVCEATGRGMVSPDIANMLVKELKASMSVSLDITSTAIVQYGC